MFERIRRAATMLAGIWEATRQPYSPSSITGLVDGSRYGSNVNSLNTVIECEALSTSLVRKAEAVSSCAYEVLGPGEKPLPEEHPVIKFLAKPNPLMGWTEFIETLIFQFDPTGNAYLAIGQVALAGNPLELWPLRPDKTRPIKDPVKHIAGYEHYSESGQRFIFPPERVVHLKRPNPFTPYIGLGLTEMVDMTLNMDHATLEYNWRFFLHGASLGTVLQTDADLGEDKVKLVAKQFREMHAGYKNAHRVAVLTNGLKASNDSVGRGPKETDWHQTRADIGNTLGGLLGVPPIKRGIVENANRANSVTQEAIFISDAVSPMNRRLERAFDPILKLWGPFRLKIKDPILRADDTEATVSTQAFQQGAMTPNERRRALGLEESNEPGMDDHYIPINMVKVGEEMELGLETFPTGAPPGPGGIKPPPKIGPDGGAASGGAPALAKPPAPLKEKAVDPPEGPFPKGSALQRRVLKYLLGGRTAKERKFKRLYSKWFRSFGDAAAEAVEGKRSLAVGDLEAILKAEGQPAEGGLVSYIMPTYGEETTQTYDDLAKLFDITGSFGPGQGEWSTANVRLAERVKGIEDGARVRLQEIVQEGSAQGLSPYEIANGTADGSFAGIRGEFDDMAQERAQLIARTESAAVEHQGAIQAYKDMGIAVVDIIGCEDFVKMPGEVYGCNSQNIPIAAAAGINFHPNHNGAPVPRLEKAIHASRALILVV